MSSEATQQVSSSSSSGAFVTAWKKAAGPQKQTTLQTKSEAFTKYCLEEGWGLKEMKVFQQLLEACKTSVGQGEANSALSLLTATLDFAFHLEVHPIALITFSRNVVGASHWDSETLVKCQEYLARSDDDDEVIASGAVSTGDEVMRAVEYQTGAAPKVLERVPSPTQHDDDDDVVESDGGKRKRRLFPESTRYD